MEILKNQFLDVCLLIKTTWAREKQIKITYYIEIHIQQPIC